MARCDEGVLTMAKADGAIAPEKDNQGSETEASGLLKARVDEVRAALMRQRY